mmetsp:Transcript_87803/g.151529  ORF Transcript_87803/g.151529 Transcript_87803/m.151529 type:complete len:859 (+) Transcript_87803:1-2577(+)
MTGESDELSAQLLQLASDAKALDVSALAASFPGKVQGLLEKLTSLSELAAPTAAISSAKSALESLLDAASDAPGAVVEAGLDLLDFASDILDNVDSSVDAIKGSSLDVAKQLPGSSDLVEQIKASILETAKQVTGSSDSVEQIRAQLEATFPDTQAVLLPLACGLVGVAVLSGLSDQEGTPYPAGVYDAKAARDFFFKRPFAVLARTVSLLVRSAGFGLALLADASTGQLEARSDQRAVQLTELLTELGPTFIKVGQTASIRTDLLPPAYIKGLTQLQDEVPPFPNQEARAIIEAEFEGKFPFSSLSDEPIAAASLGQVYKGTLLNGTEVAVKVQRPHMERLIALDMLLIRDFAMPLAKAFGIPGDLIGTADAWGKGFVDELNYKEEAVNAARFNRDVVDSALSGRVFAPDVVSEASGRRVLTTVWIDGERLDRCSAPDDVGRLCSVAMNTYMEMMLDSGVMHADPHPGNLLRTPDGKLCILDWGLVTPIRPDIQLTLIEHIAHLTSKDYGKIPSDLVKLDFVPEGAESSVMDNGVMDFLTEVYDKRSEGGGFANFDVPKVFDELQALASESENGLFQIPPYFAYIAKAFAVLEGIALTDDPDYSIIDETLPYISRRILTDPSPRTAGALETFIFGDEKSDVEGRVLDAGRVKTLVDGAQSFASSTIDPEHVSAGEAIAGETPSIAVAGFDVDAASDAIFDLLLTKDATPLQDIVLEQLALIIGAQLRETWADLRENSGRLGDSGRSFLGTLVDPLGLFRGSPLIQTDARDRKALDAASKLASIASELIPVGAGQVEGPLDAPRPGTAVQPSTAELTDLVQKLSSKLWERRDELQVVSQRLLIKLLSQTSQRTRMREL